MPADLVTRLFLKDDNFTTTISKCKKETKSFQKGLSYVQGSVKNFVAGFAGMAGVSVAFMDIVQKSMEFEKSLSSLRSLTGVTTKELEYFKDAAIELGSTSTQTASQVVEAFQLIGSQQPELLKNKEALVDVTKQAITLAEAAGMSVPEAARALSGSLNQMGESANMAKEYINILAAASQEGAADIPYLTKAIERSGGAASSVGVKYNELVAAIEAIAPKITDASEAGTSLRNIFLTLESASDSKLKPSVVGLTKALENLADKNMDATQMTKMFGKENVTAALAIVNAKDEYKKLLDAITGTNTAIEQQKINNDNLAGSINAVSSAWEGFILTLNKSNGFISQTAKGIAGLIQDLTNLMKSQEDLAASDIDKKAEKIASKVKAAYEANKSGGLSDERSMQLAAIEYDNTEAGKIEVLKSDLSSLMSKYDELAHKKKVIDLSTGYYNSQLKKDVNQEFNDIKDRISLIKDEIKVRELADQKVKDYLKSLNKVSNGNQSNNTITGVTDEMRKEWEKQSKRENRDYSFLFSAESAKAGIQSEIKKLADSADFSMKLPVELMIVPVSTEVEERDIRGSIEDYQEQLQALTEAYNQESNAAIRKGYEKRMDDLQSLISNMSYKSPSEKEKPEDYLNGIASMLSAINGLTAEGAAQWLQWGATVLGTIANAIPAIEALTAAQKAQAVAGAVAGSTAAGPLGWITAAAAVASVMAALASATFTTGGIVPGGQYVGDKVPILANSGEMVLTTGQQEKLFRMISAGSYGGGNITISGELKGQGDALIATINNTNRKKSRMR